MKVLKRNQIIIFVIALMLMAAGYLNYTASNGFIPASSSSDITSEDIKEMAGIGDATLVSGNIVEENTQESISDTDTVTQETQNIVEEVNTTEDNTNTVTTNTEAEKDDYFASSKLGRSTMYSQMIESYQKILENATISEAQKTIASEEIKKINDTQNAIMIAENLIQTKGFEDCAILVNDKSINIIVKAEELKPEEIAQIQNIASRELKAEIEDIHISNK
mgnify:FL=1